jgi:hypothetical protein
MITDENRETRSFSRMRDHLDGVAKFLGGSLSDDKPQVHGARLIDDGSAQTAVRGQLIKFLREET